MTTSPIARLGDLDEYAELQDEINQINVSHGWHETSRTRREGNALIHSEISEALEAYRQWGLEDQTGPTPEVGALPKPEGVGSEFADVFIRVLDELDRRGIRAGTPEHGDLAVARVLHYGRSFGDDIDVLHFVLATGPLTDILAHLVVLARKYGLDLLAEVRRKVAYNHTRPHRHGGKRL